MATLTVSLPKPITDWIDTQIESGRYASPSDYVRDLVRQDREQTDERAALRDLIDQAESSGVSPRTLDEIFMEARAKAGQRRW